MDMKEDFAIRVSRWILWLVAIFPLGLAVFCSIPNFFGGWGLFWEGHDYAFYFLPDVVRHLPLGLPLAVAWIAFFVWFCRRQLQGEMKHLPLKIFLLTLVTRGIIALTIGQFVSLIGDCQFAWDRACTGALDPEFTSHLLSPPWMNFSMFARYWVLAFGLNMGLGLLFVSVLFDAITAAMIFNFSDQVFKCRAMALVASCLYALYPSSIIFILSPTSEHMGIACFMAMAAILSKCILEEMPVMRLMLLVAIAGVIAGLGNSVKQILIVYAIAAAIMFCLILFRSQGRKKMLISIASMVVFALMAICTDRTVGWCCEKTFKVTIQKI